MTTLKTVTLAAALFAGASSLTMAQDLNRPPNGNNGMPPASYKGPGAMQKYPVQGNTAANAAASGGSGTHSTAQKTGSAANTEKVIHNQNGYDLNRSASNGMPPASYKGPGAMPSYPVQANAAASGGSGTHSTAQKTGSAANTEKVINNQSGYRNVGRFKGKGLYSDYRGRHRKMAAIRR